MPAMGWRVKAGALALFVVAVAVVVVIVGLGSGSSPADSTPTAAHRRVAVSEAARLLRDLRLPGNATAVSSGAAGIQAPGLQLIGSPSTSNVAVSTRGWLVPEPSERVAAFLLAHPVPGTRVTHPDAADVIFTAQRPASGLTAAQIALVLSPAGPRTTIVHVSASATWVVARSASEAVPATARVVDIVRGKPGHAPGIALKVTDPQLSAIRRLIDALPTAQPGRVSCPERVNGLPRVSFIFRTREGGPVLAIASEDADVVEPTTVCNPLSFSIGGSAQTPLLGGAALLRRVSRIVHHRLWLPPYAA